MVVPIRIRFSGYQPPASVHSRAAAVFGRALADRLGDAVRFEFDGNIIDSGRAAADLLTMVESGEIAMCYFSASYLANRVPAFALLDMPFTITDRDQAYAVLDGPLGTILADRLQTASGYRVLGFWDNGFRHFSNARRPIRTPEDCRGLRLRTLFSDLHAEVFAMLGFDPVALDVKDLLAAVAAGTIDAQENPLTNTYNFGLHRHHPYITLSSHFFGAALLLCNQAAFAGWPPEVRAAVEQAAAEATAAQRTFAAEDDESVLVKLRQSGNEVIALSEPERAAFAAAVAPLIETQRRKFGAELFDYLR